MDHGYLELHTRFSTWAIDWDKQGRDEGIVLRGAYLKVLDEFCLQAETTDPPPSDLMEDFFTESRVQALKDAREAQMLEVMLESRSSGQEEVTPGSVEELQMELQKILNTAWFQYTMLAFIFLDFLLGFASIVIDSFGDNNDRKAESYEVLLSSVV